MKNLLLTLIMLALTATAVAMQSDTAAEAARIRQTILTSYVEGLQNEGDTVKINAGFHPGFEMLMLMKDGTLKKYPLTEWKARLKADLAEGRLPRKGDNLVSVRFIQVDVTINAATAKFGFYVGDKLTFIDYMSLYKFGDTWKIVSKTYQKL